MRAPAAESPANLKRQTAGPEGGGRTNALEGLGLALGFGLESESESVGGESDVVAISVLYVSLFYPLGFSSNNQIPKNLCTVWYSDKSYKQIFNKRTFVKYIIYTICFSLL